MRHVTSAVIALACVCGYGCGAAAPGAPLSLGSVARLPRPTTSRVIVVVMENAEYGEALDPSAAPFTAQLARRYGLATESFAVMHPSLPNYLALTSGSTHGVSSDCTECSVSGQNIVDQLQAAGIGWAAYLEGVAGPCFRGASAGGYAKKHNPFLYYDDVAGSPARCRHLLGFGALATAIRTATLPTYTWITPNLCDDGHDCGVAGGERFLARTVPALLSQLGPHGFLVLTWDEGVSDNGCCGLTDGGSGGGCCGLTDGGGGHVATIVAGPDVRPGARERTPLDHYGVLASIEQALGLPRLAGAGDPLAGSLAPLFSGGSIPRVR
jgi:hypothetical protein